MDPSTASYYRAILFKDGTSDRKLPESLVLLHGWVLKRHLALGLGGIITKAVSLTVVLTWLSSTADGRKFAADHAGLGEMFGPVPDDEPEDAVSTEAGDMWDRLPRDTEVVIQLRDKTVKKGQFLSRRGGWVEVRVEGTAEFHRISKVKPAGV